MRLIPADDFETVKSKYEEPGTYMQKIQSGPISCSMKKVWNELHCPRVINGGQIKSVSDT